LSRAITFGDIVSGFYIDSSKLDEFMVQSGIEFDVPPGTTAVMITLDGVVYPVSTGKYRGVRLRHKIETGFKLTVRDVCLLSSLGAKIMPFSVIL